MLAVDFRSGQLNTILRSEMDSFVKGTDVNVSFLARGVRRVFAHGVMAGAPAGVSGATFDEISQRVSTFLLDCMNSDFSDRAQ